MSSREEKDRADELSWGTTTPGPLEDDELWEDAPGAEGRADTRGGTREEDLRDIDTSTLGGSSASGSYGTGDYADDTLNSLDLAEDLWDDADEVENRARRQENQGGEQGRSAGTETGLTRNDGTER